MSLNMWMRQIHRWLSIIFTVAFIGNLVASMLKKETVLIGLTALIPILLMFATGLYLFVLPYLGGKARAPAAGG